LYADGLQIWMTVEITCFKSVLNFLKQASEVGQPIFDARGICYNKSTVRRIEAYDTPLVAANWKLRSFSSTLLAQCVP